MNNDPNHPVDLEIAEGDGESDSVEDARTGSDLGSRPSKRGVQLRRAKQQGRHPSPVGDIQPEGGDVTPPPVSGTVGDQDPQIPSAASSRAERAGRHWARQQRAQQRKQITTSSSSPDASDGEEGGSRWERQMRQRTILRRDESTFMGEEEPKTSDGEPLSLEIPSITEKGEVTTDDVAETQENPSLAAAPPTAAGSADDAQGERQGGELQPGSYALPRFGKGQLKKIAERGRKASASGGGGSTPCRSRSVSVERRRRRREQSPLADMSKTTPSGDDLLLDRDHQVNQFQDRSQGRGGRGGLSTARPSKGQMRRVVGRGRPVTSSSLQNASRSPSTERRMHRSLSREPKQAERSRQERSSPVSPSMRSHAPAPSSIAARDDEKGNGDLSLGGRPNIPSTSSKSVKVWEITKRRKDRQEKKEGQRPDKEELLQQQQHSERERTKFCTIRTVDVATAVSPPISPKTLKIEMTTERMPPAVLSPNSAAAALVAPVVATPASGVRSHIALRKRTNTKSSDGKGEVGSARLSGALSKVSDVPNKTPLSDGETKCRQSESSLRLAPQIAARPDRVSLERVREHSPVVIGNLSSLVKRTEPSNPGTEGAGGQIRLNSAVVKSRKPSPLDGPVAGGKKSVQQQRTMGSRGGTAAQQRIGESYLPWDEEGGGKQPHPTAPYADPGTQPPKRAQPATSGGMLADRVALKMKEKGSMGPTVTSSGGVRPGEQLGVIPLSEEHRLNVLIAQSDGNGEMLIDRAAPKTHTEDDGPSVSMQGDDWSKQPTTNLVSIGLQTHQITQPNKNARMLADRVTLAMKAEGGRPWSQSKNAHSFERYEAIQSDQPQSEDVHRTMQSSALPEGRLASIGECAVLCCPL